MTRRKGRDIYDLWFLLNQGVDLIEDLVLEKFKYYGIEPFDKNLLIERVKGIDKEQFITDLRPFVSINQRNKLADFYEFVIEFIRKKMA